jgi:hypothetical protein
VAVCSPVGRIVSEADFHIVEGFHGLSTMVELKSRKATPPPHGTLILA